MTDKSPPLLSKAALVLRGWSRDFGQRNAIEAAFKINGRELPWHSPSKA